MGVDHPRDDEEAGAVDDLGALGRVGDDPAARDGDVGASEVTRADIDETVLKQQLCQTPASVATSATASVGMTSSGTVFAKSSQSRTRPMERTTATRPTYRPPAISHDSTGTGPQLFCGVE